MKLNIKELFKKLVVRQEVTCTIASGWTNYTTGLYPVVNRVGGVAEFYWTCKPTTAINPLNTTEHIVCTIPEGYRPIRNLYHVMQGSGTSIFHVTIKADGTVAVSRLRDMANSNGAYTNATTSMWFPICATYIIGG